MQERRTQKRVNMNGRLNVDFSSQDNPDLIKRGLLMNISNGGMYIRTVAALKKGALISASLNADDLGKVIPVQGWVVRSVSNGLAIEFSDADQRGIHELMSPAFP